MLKKKIDPSITVPVLLILTGSTIVVITTFTTAIDNVSIEEGKYKDTIKNAYELYLNDREVLENS